LRRQLAQAISLYRDRFSTIGLFENLLYPQIPATLKTLRTHGYKTFVAMNDEPVHQLAVETAQELSQELGGYVWRIAL
jgi:phosphoglycolate phosphatase